MAVTWDSVVSNKHIALLRQKGLTSWRLLNDFLDLEDTIPTSIDKEGGSEEEKKGKFLKKWKEEKGDDATYRQLHGALLSSKVKKDADYLATLVQGPPPSSAGSSAGASLGPPPSSAGSSAGVSLDKVVSDSAAIPKNTGAFNTDLQPADLLDQQKKPQEGFVEIQQVKGGEVKSEEVDGNPQKRGRLGKRSLFTATPKFLWHGYKELRVFFMKNDKEYMLDGFADDAAHNKMVLDWMNEWNHNSSSVPKFKLVHKMEDSDIRVAYSEDSETIVGMEATDFKNEASMELNLNYVHESLLDQPAAYAYNYKRYTVLHETGHALGFYHEHQHPIFSGDLFERANIIADLQSEYNWSLKKANKKYDENFGPEKDPGFDYPFERDSIMRYQMKRKWVKPEHHNLFFGDDTTTEINEYCFPRSALSGALTDSDVTYASKVYECPPTKKGALKTDNKLSQEDVYYLLYKYLSPCVHKWKILAENLGFKPDKIGSIDSDARFGINAPGSYLVAVLQIWQNQFPRDATLDKLTEAVKKVWPDVPDDMSLNYDDAELQSVTWDDLWGILNKE